MNDERSKIIKELLNIVSIEDEKEQAEKIVNLVADLVQGIGCVLYKLDETSENIKPIASTKDWFKELINKGIAVKYPKSIGLTGWIFNTAKPLLIDNTSKFVIERNGWKTLDDNELNNYCSIADPLEINEDDCWIKW
ncbi:MAG: hypothetical protein GTO45_04790, partial [Candidatus Aminicenantes bacterium]|nr:hypothetical protein [Candidatus Aminicenantes bacterium]NIM81302.1 hypothetical protein [Candidatus Aminicenantes bacterium]NIN17387.1 hypothetical protein [Candidatus Aminicenantes bacterium]NIN41280.1 hypothetical protein [Candidatus Aminicenantes bacterium]NIN84053.1 hypothetical protein [Candidatus Aminicenantes bacterium]